VINPLAWGINVFANPLNFFLVGVPGMEDKEDSNEFSGPLDFDSEELRTTSIYECHEWDFWVPHYEDQWAHGKEDIRYTH